MSMTSRDIDGMRTVVALLNALEVSDFAGAQVLLDHMDPGPTVLAFAGAVMVIAEEAGRPMADVLATLRTQLPAVGDPA